MKKLAALLLIFTLIPSGIFAESLPVNTVQVYMNGYNLNKGDAIETFIKDDRTYLPVSLLEGQEDLEVTVDEGAKAVAVTSGDKTIHMTVDDKNYQLNDSSFEMDVAPFENGGTIYLPLRYLSEALGKKVNWDEDYRIVTVGRYMNEEPKSDDAYTTTKAGYAFAIPAEDKNRYVIEDDGGEVRFYDKKSYRKADHIGRIGTMAKVKNPADVEVPMILLTPLPGGYLIFTFSENSGISDDEKAELKQSYEDSREAIKDVLKTVKTLERISLAD